ncbi:hypothetical protein CXB51_007950 [Gossypium anomalum]|uniref:ADP/ATP translocase n=1 Tax=Gossypium anomalum TaxID=47600 RepID=A0A8J5ZSG6_9ROSI|nr:hypothetical protein CXB51_007950 [Gossypium anomalum]
MEMGKNKSEKFSMDFVMAGMAAIMSKSAAAPIERVKLLLQNQGEMIKRGSLRNLIMVLAFNFAFKGYFKSIFGRSKEKDGYAMWFAGNVASGSAAGATTSLFLYHLDYARTRLGTDGQRQFKGLLDVYRETLSTDGVVGLYRGFGASIMGITLYRGLYFGIYDTMKPILLVGPLEGNFFASFFLGWSITTVSGVCAYPFDTVRRRMMLTSGQSKKYRSAIHAFREIVHLEGFSALFRGVTANMLLGVAGAGVLAGYDHLHRVAHQQGYVFESYQGALK